MTDSPFLSDQYCPQQEGLSTSGGSTRKKKKLNELKAFVETKLRSCSEKALEKIGHDDSRRSSISDDQVSMARVNKPCFDRSVRKFCFKLKISPDLRTLSVLWNGKVNNYKLSIATLARRSRWFRWKFLGSRWGAEITSTLSSWEICWGSPPAMPPLTKVPSSGSCEGQKHAFSEVCSLLYSKDVFEWNQVARWRCFGEFIQYFFK